MDIFNLLFYMEESLTFWSNMRVKPKRKAKCVHLGQALFLVALYDKLKRAVLDCYLTGWLMF